MYKITEKVALNPTVTKMVIEAPLIAQKAKPGQFIIVRPFEDSERIPLTVAGYDREKGTVDIIFQIVGGTTMELNSLEVGQSVHDFVGPLGRATEVEGLKKVCVVGGGRRRGAGPQGLRAGPKAEKEGVNRHDRYDALRFAAGPVAFGG